MVTYFLQARIDGEPISQEYLLSILVTLVMAGLDTTKSQLGFNFHHLATHPDDRRWLVEDPDADPDRDRGDAPRLCLRAAGAQAGDRTSTSTAAR